MNNHPIGILDSGSGGFTIWKEIVKQLPNESTIYIADSKNCPYGSKTPEEIYPLAKRLVQFLLEKDVKLIVVACNTITVTSLGKLRAEFPQMPMIGIVPVIKTASGQTKNNTIGILSTSQTAKSQYQKNLIAQFAKGKTVVNVGTDELVPFIEEGRDVDAVLKKVLEPFQKAGIDTLALGCSHYPIIKKQIQQELSSNVTILDSSAAIARQVRRVLTNNQTLCSSHKPTHRFYTTGQILASNRVVQALIEEQKKEVVELASVNLDQAVDH